MTHPFNPLYHNQFEYKVISAHVVDLNTLGLEGWELVAVIMEDDRDHTRPTAYLKRIIPVDPLSI